ncbi:transposase [Taibaiella soli]|uniref:Integrase catalytic domain-containing protein n=1 Tax=Taibaiella soli TaxID=1649169 RepID=A0A2W2AKC3_9BACT|nr:transposase [Taibaiella soli]PZF74022.1 hypothetical protein DN068_04815 [Taibaiella soli]
MKTYLYDEEQRRIWVQYKYSRAKTVKQICREAGISRATLYNWINEFPEDVVGKGAGIELPFPEVKHANELVETLQAVPAEIEGSSRYRMLQSALGVVDGDKTIARKIVAVLVKRFTLTVAQACDIVGIDEEVYGYKPRKPEVDDMAVYEALVGLILEDRTRGFTECYELLIARKPSWTRKQIRRVYKERRVFQLRKRVRKVRTSEDGSVIPAATRLYRPGSIWTLGILNATTQSGTPFWIAYIIDTDTTEMLNASAGSGKAAATDIEGFLTLAASENGRPQKLRIPGQPPFNDREITRWAWEQKVVLHTLSANKSENQAEFEKWDAMVKSQLPESGVENLDNIDELIEQWVVR